ncbi:proton-coupled folate transporter-like [Condylostylus longicornis]|uniref:proton-coupled folate transporter-like n=1 Tax=Condylostylus longicornis TaxID=2530218 RepID=UPI00244E2447|nr:proton-coupled folate transporter-like [Condylostylus longicornis]
MSTDIIEVKWYKKILQWCKLITIEPTMFLYMFAIMFTSVVEQAFFVRKACLVNHNYTVEICDNIVHHEEVNIKVQHTTSNFFQYESIAAHIFPIILALFLGAWSDKRGRKLPLLLGLTGKFIFYVMMIINENQPSWPLEYVIYTATLPCSLTGGDIAIFASSFAYITDVSTLQSRTIRVTILEAVTLITTPTGVALGSYLFHKVLNKSFSWMFAITAIMILTAILYTFLVLKWQSNPKQRSLKELGCCGIWRDYFDKQHVFDSIKVLTKRRTQSRRLFLILILFSMALYTFVRDEKAYLFLHTQHTFGWDVQDFSNYKTFQSSAYIVVLFIAVPVMNKIFKWRDTVIILFGCIAHAIARLIYFFADTSLIFYLGSIVCSFGPIAGPALRAFTSKIIPVVERGKVFALLSVCDNAVPFISGVLYTQVYNATLGSMAGLFLLSFSFLILAICLISIIHFKLGHDPIIITEEILDNKSESVASLVSGNSPKTNKELNTKT